MDERGNRIHDRAWGSGWRVLRLERDRVTPGSALASLDCELRFSSQAMREGLPQRFLRCCPGNREADLHVVERLQEIQAHLQVRGQ